MNEKRKKELLSSLKLKINYSKLIIPRKVNGELTTITYVENNKLEQKPFKRPTWPDLAYVKPSCAPGFNSF